MSYAQEMGQLCCQIRYVPLSTIEPKRATGFVYNFCGQVTAERSALLPKGRHIEGNGALSTTELFSQDAQPLNLGLQGRTFHSQLGGGAPRTGNYSAHLPQDLNYVFPL